MQEDQVNSSVSSLLILRIWFDPARRNKILIVLGDAGDGLDVQYGCDEVALRMKTITKLDSKWRKRTVHSWKWWY